MKRELLIASILAVGMGIAQAQTQAPAPMQSGQGQSTSAPGPQSQSPTTMSPGPAAGSDATGVASNQNAPQTFKGCLRQSAGSWTLASDDGKSLAVSGADDKLIPHNGQEVRINGTQAADGTLAVASIDKVSDSCGESSANQSQSTSGAQTASTDQGNQSNMNSQQATTTTNSTTQSATTTTPSSSQAAPSSTTSTDQNAATSSSATTTSNNDQNAGMNASGSNSNQNAGQGAASSSTQSNAAQSNDQSVPHISDMDQNQNANGQKQLPQTASPLPLLGLLGLGSLVTGLAARRKK